MNGREIDKIWIDEAAEFGDFTGITDLMKGAQDHRTDAMRYAMQGLDRIDRQRITPQGSLHGNGKMLGLCRCGHCKWTGRKDQLREPKKKMPVDPRKPSGLCPNCNARPRWRKTTDQQIRLLMP